jgi:2-polyprenyl-6-methoxyphenol hydroxylase-like FAD-dependent oxidoreductase
MFMWDVKRNQDARWRASGLAFSSSSGYTWSRERSLEKTPVLIVGGGIAGLALGRALRAHGIAAEIIERTTAWTPAGTGIYLPANGVRALQSLGLGDAVMAGSVRMTAQRILDNRGRLLAEIDLDGV